MEMGAKSSTMDGQKIDHNEVRELDETVYDMDMIREAESSPMTSSSSSSLTNPPSGSSDLKKSENDVQEIKRYGMDFLYGVQSKCTVICDELWFKINYMNILRLRRGNKWMSWLVVKGGLGHDVCNENDKKCLHINFLLDHHLIRLVENYNQMHDNKVNRSELSLATTLSMNLSQDREEEYWFGPMGPSKRVERPSTTLSKSSGQDLEEEYYFGPRGPSKPVERQVYDNLQTMATFNQIGNEIPKKSKSQFPSTLSVEERQRVAEQLKQDIKKKLNVVNNQIQNLKKTHTKDKPQTAVPSTSKASSLPQQQSKPVLPLLQMPKILQPVAKESPSKRLSESRSSTTSTSTTLTNGKPSRKERKRNKETTINGKPVTKESYLILSLLSLSDNDREKYLIKVAKERDILKRNPKDGVLSLNPKYGGLFPIVKNEAVKNIEQMAPCVVQINGDRKQVSSNSNHTRKESTGPSGKYDQAQDSKDSVKRIKPDSLKKGLTYEEQIMLIVNEIEDLPKNLKDLQYNLGLRSKNESNEERQEILDFFTKQLVAWGKGHMHSGEVRINNKNYFQAFVNDREAKDVFIGTPCLRKFALQGDIVEVYVHHGLEIEFPEQESNDSNESPDILDQTAEPIFKAPTKLGFVTRIIEKRHTRRCVGTFFAKDFTKDSKSAKFVPRDNKMPLIFIPKQNWPNALLVEKPEDIANVVYMAEIIDWKDEKAIGNVIKSLGQCGELEVENTAILVANNLSITPFEEEILAQLPPSPFVIPSEEIEKREDLRDEIVFTIDPLTARDLDDALSLKLLPSGNFEIGVHISDVSYFLKEGTELDDIVKEKATTIYMVNNVYHMLPKPLCFLCSLLPGEDKLAFSVFWEMTPDATIVSTRFAKTIVNSCTQFAYEHAQKIIDQGNDQLDATDFPEIQNGVTLKQIQYRVLRLNSLATLLRKKRMAKGALKIDQPKLSFRLNPETGQPIEYNVYELKESNRMIEDWMLLANCSVAAYIYQTFPKTSILRAHSKPNDNSLDNLEGTLKKHGLELVGRNSTELRESMEKIIASSQSPDGARAALNVMLSKPMQRAKYFCSGMATTKEDFYHFALAVNIYTHFTSPIRRYADVMVHRALSAAIACTPPSERDTQELQSLALICNTQKWAAKTAGEQCSDLYFKTYLNSVGSIKTRAAVISLGAYSLEVVLLETGHCIKLWYKYLEPHTIVKCLEETKISHVYMWWPKDQNMTRKISLFTELFVEVTVQKNKLSINKVFPN